MSTAVIREDRRARIRIAASADTEALVGLIEAFRDYLALPEPSPREARERLPACLEDPATEILLAEDEGHGAVGFLQIRFRPSIWYGPEAEVEDLFVAAAARGAGVGRCLFEAACERARARGCRHLSLNTNENNQAAVALYESFGLDARRARWAGGRQLWLDRDL